jgi:NAD(P)-dependent dehydrogenase (short-subunit alcohol dehydrogenase family)
MARALPPGGVAVVTGAAQGIGRAIALRLAAAGAKVAAWDVQPEGAADTVRACQQAGAEARSWRVDIGDEWQIVNAAEEVCGVWGVPDALVNNAGIFPRSLALEMEIAEWQRVIGVNLTGTFLCSRTFGRRMVEARRGAIVNIAYGRALQGAIRGAHYAATKAGIVSLTKTLALEWASHGVRVNCVIPGVTDTAQPLAGITRDELIAQGAASIPLGRIGQPEDVANVVAFLLSSEAAYMTGQAVAVNGGAIMIP